MTSRPLQHMLAAVISIAIVGFVLWSRRDPVEIYGADYAHEVKAGQTLRVVRSGKFLRSDCVRTVSTWIVDSQGTTWSRVAEITGYALDMRTPSIAREIPIPYSAAWGKARYLQQISYSCFPFGDLWPIVVDLPELTFTIEPPR